MRRSEGFEQSEYDFDPEEPKEQKPVGKSILTEEERIAQKDEWDRQELGYSLIEYDEFKTNYEIEHGENYVNPLI